MTQLIFILILINAIIYPAIFIYISQKNFVAFLNAGQGGGVLISDKNNYFLYDTSRNSNYFLEELKKIIPFFVKTIDILFISHPDKDHYFAVFELLKRYKIRLVILSSKTSSDVLYKKLLALLQETKTPFIVLKRGSLITTNNFKFTILNPAATYKNLKDNDNSLVVKIEGKYSYLLTGDIEKKAMDFLLLCCRSLLASDYLLVPHHGSKYSINKDFYQAVKPKEVIIQAGINNIYKHPHKETIDFIYNLGFIKRIWRTNHKGTLIIIEK